MKLFTLLSCHIMGLPQINYIVLVSQSLHFINMLATKSLSLGHIPRVKFQGISIVVNSQITQYSISFLFHIKGPSTPYIFYSVSIIGKSQTLSVSYFLSSLRSPPFDNYGRNDCGWDNDIIITSVKTNRSLKKTLILLQRLIFFLKLQVRRFMSLFCKINA